MPKTVPNGSSLQAAGHLYKDWAPVFWHCPVTGHLRYSVFAAPVKCGKRAAVEISEKFAGGRNLSAHSVCSNAKALDENTEVFRHATVSHDFKMALQQARLAKKMTQAALATSIN